MIATNQLPDPPYRQGKWNLCALAAFATATYPFCQLGLGAFLFDFKRTYDPAFSAANPGDVCAYYEVKAKEIFDQFKLRFGTQLQMFDWFDFLGQVTDKTSFHEVQTKCSLQKGLGINEFAKRLRDETSMGSIGIAVGIGGNDPDVAHYVNVWFDGADLCMRDSRYHGNDLVDAKAGSVDELVNNCGVATEFKMLNWWRVLVIAR